MAIEGPLRELGIHDVFQLLDLSRKTGTLTVSSTLRDNQGTVFFDNGALVFASIRSNPHRLGELLLRGGKITEADLARARDMQLAHTESRKLGEILLAIGAISRRELERQVRFQVEEVVFELTSWREGYFRFEERDVSDAPAEANIRIAIESLLMEGARRIDEWSRIEGKVPGLEAVPAFSESGGEQAGMLDLLPNEWEVLAGIDGQRDLRTIAASLGRSDFDVAKIAYGLVTTGVIDLTMPDATVPGRSALQAAAAPYLSAARDALSAGDLERARNEAARAVALDPERPEARLLAGRALRLSGQHGEAVDELRRALQFDALNAEVHLELGYAAAARGDFEEAIASWERHLRIRPDGSEAQRIRAAMDVASRMRAILEEASCV
jgi:hypothetical protein